MKTLFYSTRDFEAPYLKKANKKGYDVTFREEELTLETVSLSKGYEAVSCFTSGDASAQVLEKLSQNGVQYIAIRAAGYDNIDLDRAKALGIKAANVPEYSPYAIAEHTVAMMLALNRKIVLAHEQVHRHDFTLAKLTGFDLHGKTAGVVGTGRIGSATARILHGFGCRVLAYDIEKNDELEEKGILKYTELEALCSESDIITLHVPLKPQTRYMVDKALIKQMKRGVMLINTSRGALVKTEDVIEALENSSVGYFGMDVYEHERGIFFRDLSGTDFKDPLLDKLLAMPNVLVTPHQAFNTKEALRGIAETTFYNLGCWVEGRESPHAL